MVKNPPAKQKMQVRSLDWEDSLEMATHSSILAWENPWTEESDGLQSMVGVSHSVVSDSATSWTVACQVPLSIEFSRHEYWSR